MNVRNKCQRFLSVLRVYTASSMIYNAFAHLTLSLSFFFYNSYFLSFFIPKNNDLESCGVSNTERIVNN